MCYNVNQDGEQLELEFGAEFKAKPKKRRIKKEAAHHLNGFAHPLLMVLANDKPGELQEMQWGLIPFWVKSQEQAGDIANKTLNAKSETIFELPSFRDAILKRRCIIPVKGFYEWRHFNKKTYPYFIYPKDGNYFRLGGLWEEWTDRETGEIKRTCSIITTAANPLMEHIHNIKMRMPLILSYEDSVRWISDGLSKEAIRQIMSPYGKEHMESHTISRRITSRTENPNVDSITEPVCYEELPPMNA